jgi:hypothetical protein
MAVLGPFCPFVIDLIDDNSRVAGIKIPKEKVGGRVRV